MKKILSFSLCLIFALTMLLPVACVSAAENYADYTAPATATKVIFSGATQWDSKMGTGVAAKMVSYTENADTTVTFTTTGTAGTHTIRSYNTTFGGGTTVGTLASNPKFMAGERYVLGGIKLKNNSSDLSITPKFGVQLISFGTAAVGMKGEVSDHVDVTASGDSWQEYSHTFTITTDTPDDGASLFVAGLPSRANGAGPGPYVISGSSVIADVANAYLETEILNITNELSADTVAQGGTVSGQASVVNQAGATGLDQTMTYIVLNADRTAVVEDIVVTPGENGAYTVTVGKNVAAGTYNILARSSAYSNETTQIQKAAELSVVAGGYAEYVADTEEKVVINGGTQWTGRMGAGIKANMVSYTNNGGNTVTFTTTGTAGTHTIRSYNTTFGGATSAANINNSTTNPHFMAGERYIVTGIKLKNNSAAGITPKFGMQLISFGTAAVGMKGEASDHVDVTVTGDNWQEYSHVFEIPADTPDDGGSVVVAGLPSRANGAGPGPYVISGSSVIADVSNVYIAKELMDITNVLPVTMVAQGGTLSGTAKVVNQLGGTTGLDQTMSVIVLDANRNAEVPGFTVNMGANGAYTVTVGASVAPGQYVVLARNATNSDGIMNRGVTITVVENHYNDYEAAEPKVVFGDAESFFARFTSSANMVSATKDTVNNTVTYTTTGTAGAHTVRGKTATFGGTANAANIGNTAYAPHYLAGERYILGGLKLRNVSQDASITPEFGVQLMSFGKSAFIDEVRNSVAVTATGDSWQEYSHTFTIAADTPDDGASLTVLGLPARAKGVDTPYAVTGASVLADVSNIYLEQEVIDITNVIADTTVAPGETISGTTKVVNQKGSTSDFDQTMDVIVLDAERTAPVSGFTVSMGANGAYTVAVDASVAPGEYVVLGRNLTNNGVMNRGVIITVEGSTIEGISIAKDGDNVKVSTDTALENAQLIFVSYDANGKMIDFSIVDVNLDAQAEQSYAYKAGFNVQDDTRVMLWVDRTNCVAYTDVLNY